jgi:hypothetical protein
MITLTRKQRVALHRKWLQDTQFMTYRKFRKTIQYGSFGCIMVQWCGMWLGIETDGYTHS